MYVNPNFSLCYDHGLLDFVLNSLYTFLCDATPLKYIMKSLLGSCEAYWESTYRLRIFPPQR